MKKGWLFLLALLCAAFLVSCGKKNDAEGQAGELVRIEKQELFTYEKINPLSARL